MKAITFKNLAEQYQFENGIAGVKTVAFGNLFLLVLILVGTGEKVGFMSHGFFSLISGLIIFLGILFYNWSNAKINFGFLLIYTIILLVELYFIGIPAQLMADGLELGKGFLLGIFVYMVPYIYLGIRITCIIPLVIISYRAKKLN